MFCVPKKLRRSVRLGIGEDVLSYIERTKQVMSIDAISERMVGFYPIPLTRKEWKRRKDNPDPAQVLRVKVLKLHKLMIANKRQRLFFRASAHAMVTIENNRLRVDTFDAGYPPIFAEDCLHELFLRLLTTYFTSRSRHFFALKHGRKTSDAVWHPEDADQATFKITSAWYEDNEVVWKLLRVLIRQNSGCLIVYVNSGREMYML